MDVREHMKLPYPKENHWPISVMHFTWIDKEVRPNLVPQGLFTWRCHPDNDPEIFMQAKHGLLSENTVSRFIQLVPFV